MEAFLSSIAILPFEDADANAAGAIRAALQKQGQPIGAYDVLIAGCALARGLVVVTSNLGEFQRINEMVTLPPCTHWITLAHGTTCARHTRYQILLSPANRKAWPMRKKEPPKPARYREPNQSANL